MFNYDDKYKTNIRMINGVIFSCDEYKQHYDELAERLSQLYEEKLSGIVAYLLPLVQRFYDRESFEITETILTESLGTPIIDLSTNTITYCNQTLDNEHIFSLEYHGDFDAFDNMSIDG